MKPKRDILIVDDDSTSLMLLAADLQIGGYSVRQAAGGEAALAEVAVKIPELILLDVCMPGLDGFEVLKRLKAKPETREIPVIFLSALVEAEDRLKGLKLGAVDFISKPFQKEELLAKVWTLLELSGVRAKLALALQASQMGVWQLDLGENKRTFDGRVCALLGLDPEKFGGTPGEFFSAVHPADLETVKEALKKTIEQNHPYAPEYRVIWPDKSVHYLADRGQLIRGSDGSPQLITGMLWDITGRKRTELEREKLLTAIEQTGEIIIIADTEGVIQYVNPAFERSTGYSRGEVMGQNPRMLKSGRQDDAFYRNLWATITSGSTWFGRMVNKRKDGTLYTEEATISPVRDAAGKIVNYVAVKRDITEHLQLENQLLQSQKMEAVGLLASGISHDFNNILTAIKGYSAILMNTLAAQDPRRGDIGEILLSADRATMLTRQLLAFSRKQVLAPKIVDVNKALSDMVKMLQRIIGENIKLSTKLFAAPCLAKVDPGQMEQVIMNLVVNSRDAVANNGEISLETEIVLPSDDFFAGRPELARGKLVCVKVRDNGCGMSPEVKKHIFDPFFTTKEKGKGTGLGLPMVYGTVKQSGGEIDVESAEGRGSVFLLYFPLAEAAASGDTSGQEQGAVKTGTETILLVEDEDSLRRLGERMLRAYGYTVISAVDGKEGLAAAERHGKPIDLLLSDVVMPGMSGRELGMELARRKMVRRIVYMSGYTDDAIMKHGVLEPGILFIYKPFTVEDLTNKIRQALDGPADQARA